MCDTSCDIKRHNKLAILVAKHGEPRSPTPFPQQALMHPTLPRFVPQLLFVDPTEDKIAHSFYLFSQAGKEATGDLHIIIISASFVRRLHRREHYSFLDILQKNDDNFSVGRFDSIRFIHSTLSASTGCESSLPSSAPLSLIFPPRVTAALFPDVQSVDHQESHTLWNRYATIYVDQYLYFIIIIRLLP